MTLLTCTFHRSKLAEAVRVWAIITPESIAKRDFTRSKETDRRHALEDCDKTLAVVQDLERKLQIKIRWTPEHPKWEVTSEMVVKRQYCRCLDTLEGLVVARLFELTKMNMSQTSVYFLALKRVS